MTKHKECTRKRIMLVVLWIAFLAAACVIVFRIEYRLCAEDAQMGLERQADGISALLPVMEENDQYAAESIRRVMPARMNSLAVGLDKYSNLNDAQLLLDEYAKVSGLESLVILDTKGRVLYGDSDLAREMALDAEVAAAYLDGEAAQPEDLRLGTAVVGERWLLVGKNKESPAQKSVLEFYGWMHSLEILTTGQDIGITAISTEDGSILFSSDPQLIGCSLQETGFRPLGGAPFQELRELEEYLPEASGSRLVEMNGVSYYAIRVSSAPENVLLLAMLPEEDVHSSARNITIQLCQIIFLVSGLFTAYAFLHAEDQAEEGGLVEKGRFLWDRRLASRLRIAGSLAVIGVIGITFFSEILQLYSVSFTGNRHRIEQALTLYDENQNGLELVEAWSDDEYLTRTRIAQCILADQEEALTQELLADLAEALDVQAITVYDKDGLVLVTDSSYIQPGIGEDSEFYPLLQGRDYVIGTPEEDYAAGVLLRRIGVSVRDLNGTPNGCILLSEDMDEVQALNSVTRYQYLFRQLSAPVDSQMAVEAQEENEILYLGMVLEDGYAEYSQEDGAPPPWVLQEAAFTEDQLQESCDGDAELDGEHYVLSVRENDGNWFILTQPLQWISAAMLRLVVWTALTILLYALVLMHICCWKKKGPPTEQAPEEAGAENAAPGQETPRDSVLSKLGRFLWQDKLYFEERWPNESKKWRNKTAGEKYRTISRDIFLLFVIGIFIQTLAMGEDSVLNVCIRSGQGSGFNLHSFTTILITICLLVATKLIVHKILFLLARAASPRGETICHLTDSFSGYLLVIAGFFICLLLLGADTTELSLAAGIVSVILSIGCQDIITDMLAGILMTFEGVVHVGDVVYFNDQRNYVLSVGLRTTKLKIYGRTTIVRNNDFKNYIMIPVKEKVRVDVRFRVDLTESVERIEEIIAREMPVIRENIRQRWKDADDPYYWGVSDITDSWMEFRICMYCGGSYFTVGKAALNAEVKKMCDRNHIRLAMSQIVVHNADRDAQAPA